MNSVIEAHDVGVAYRQYQKPSHILSEVLFGRLRHDTFWAIRNMSFTIAQGERVGIVGPNGAGKSTLLKVIAGNLTPTRGRLAVTGRISSLLSLVPAWNEEDSGIDNIRFNLTMRGVSKRDVPRLVEEIVDFTELGAFIYQPVKTYSTGMGARLSFAIATAVDPDILIVDEVLGTGDGYFAGKAYRRMQEFCARGRALLFVSHSVNAVLQMCSRAIWVQNGEIRMDGAAGQVVAQYELDYRRSEDESLRAKQISKAETVSQAPAAEDIDGQSVKFRLIADTGRRFATTHYVRALRVTLKGQVTYDLPLTMCEESASCGIDVLRGEWGRLHERKGVECRILQRLTGRNPGGHFSFEMASLFPDGTREAPVAIDVEYSSLNERERLQVEYLDVARGEWTTLQRAGESSLEGGWRRVSQRATLRQETVELSSQRRSQLLEQTKAEVEIVEVDMRVEGESSRSVTETQLFEIAVDVEFRESVPCADVGIKITRSDGIYVFWQSSGMAQANLEHGQGRRRVLFRFTENVFGAGEYYVNVYVADGWRYPANYPYAEVFDRKTNALVFRVCPMMPEVDRGVVTKLAEVEVS